MNQEPPDTLYHYCSLQGLRGIIENKCLHMTSVFWMDDTTELFWFYEVVKRVLDQRPSDERNALHEQLQKLMEDRRLSHVFCTCFSEEPDSRSQWLEYADNGHGFAIGFDPTKFELKRTSPERSVELQRVIYDKNEQEQMAKEVIDLLQVRGNEVVDNNLRLFSANHNTWWQGVCCKNPAFDNEREWRLIYRDDPGDGLAFREKVGRQLIPFIEFPFESTKNPIREIWLGPRNMSQRNVDAVAQLLRARNYDVNHVRFPGSKIPLRPEY